MKVLFIAALIAASALAQDEIVREENFQNAWSTPTEELYESPEENLLAVAGHLTKVAPEHFQLKYHIDRVSKHAQLLQTAVEDDKAKAYSHNFAASKSAIKAALKSLTDQLNAGHAHDKDALNTSRNSNENTLTTAKANGKATATEKKHAVCPHKRAEETAHANKVAKEKAMKKVKSTKVCEPPIDFTYTDMDVEKKLPKFGTALRDAWDKARSRYSAAKGAYDAATKAHTTAVRKTETAMAEFKTALGLMAQNADKTCRDAHKEYNILKGEVASNVKARKEVDTAVDVVMCYVEHLSNNAAAKACADKARKADRSKWNISPPGLSACEGQDKLKKAWGPATWSPSMGGCAEHRRIKAEKEKATKEAAAKAKERKKKENHTKETTAKEAAAKAKVERDSKAVREAQEKRNERNAKARENKEKADERSAKERSSKETSAKESQNKERSYKSRFLARGQCCWFLHGCSTCCDKCPHGNHHVWPHTCGTSRRCN